MKYELNPTGHGDEMAVAMVLTPVEKEETFAGGQTGRDSGRDELIRALRELRQETEEQNELIRRQLKTSRMGTLVSGAAVLAMVLLLMWVVPNVVRMTGQIHAILVEVEPVVANLEKVTTDLSAVDLGETIERVNELLEGSDQAAQTALEKLESIDIVSLNQAIQDLRAVVEPLASLFSR